MLDQRDYFCSHARLVKGSRLATVCRDLRQTAILFLFFVFFLFIGVGCDRSNKITIRPTDLVNIPDLIGDSLHMLYTKDGRCEMEMRAPVMNSYSKEEKQYDEFPKGIEVYAYDSLGRVSTMLRANYALYIRKKKLWDARHNVVAVNEAGDSIQTERMFWDEEQKRIYSSESVRIRKTDVLLFGKGFESDDRFNNWEIRQPKGVITVREFADSTQREQSVK